MKKTNKRRKVADELRAEYRFDYSKSKPNRFATKVGSRRQRRMMNNPATNNKAE
jgi:hypothetical protein